MTQQRITRDDLEAKFRSLQDEVQGKVNDRKQNLVAAGAVIAAVLLVAMFLLGKRSGRKKTTFVEIRRL
ncbi:MAG: hypothetical protein RI958_3132 [Actinomycetota bacterium]|jgi:hypothetical protein